VSSHLSLARRLATLRSSRTGEIDAFALPAVVQGIRELDGDDRAHLLAALDDHSVPPLPSRLCRAVLPDAFGTAQRLLESAVLEAAGRIANLRTSADRPGPVFVMVRPLRDSVVLHVEPGWLGALVEELLPRQAGDRIVGLPCLRALARQRHVELSLLGTDPAAKVLLAEVSPKQWYQTIFSIGANEWLGNGARPLSQVERQARGRLRATGQQRLASAVLRRVSGFPRPPLAILSSEESGICYLDWDSGPSRGAVVALLRDPIVGLPPDPEHTEWVSSAYSVISTASSGPNVRQGARLVIRGPERSRSDESPAQ
jgi:hypothetical protein